MIFTGYDERTPLQAIMLELGGDVSDRPGSGPVPDEERARRMKDARDRLRQLTGRDLGYDLAAWHHFLLSAPHHTSQYTAAPAWEAVRPRILELVLNPDRMRLLASLPSAAPIAVPCDMGLTVMIEPPDGWVVAPANPPARLALVDSHASGPFMANITFGIQELNSMTPAECLTLARLQFKAMGETVVVERDEPAGSPPTPGHIFEFVAHPGPLPVRTRQVVLFHGGRALVLTAITAASQFESYRARIERCLGSVVLRFSGVSEQTALPLPTGSNRRP
jgi:hypothetical protein